jgi:hypothetical protein
MVFCLFFVFWDRVSWTNCSDWLQTTILLISASWVAKITGVSHQHPATKSYLTHLPPSTISLSECGLWCGVGRWLAQLLTYHPAQCSKYSTSYPQGHIPQTPVYAWNHGSYGGLCRPCFVLYISMVKFNLHIRCSVSWYSNQNVFCSHLLPTNWMPLPV